MKFVFALIFSLLATVTYAEMDFDPVEYPIVCVGALTSYQEEQGLNIDKRTTIAEQVTFFLEKEYRSTGRPVPSIFERVFLVSKLRKRVENDFNMLELTDIRKKCQQSYYELK